MKKKKEKRLGGYLDLVVKATTENSKSELGNQNFLQHVTLCMTNVTLEDSALASKSVGP